MWHRRIVAHATRLAVSIRSEVISLEYPNIIRFGDEALYCPRCRVQSTQVSLMPYILRLGRLTP